MKLCNDCGLLKNDDDFYRNYQTKDGLRSYCKDCISQQVHQYRQTEQGKQMQREQAAQLRTLRPELAKAKNAVNNAIRGGKLIDPDRLICAMVDSNCHGRMEYHHHQGYESMYWLDVVPLCSKHHKMANHATKER